MNPKLLGGGHGPKLPLIAVVALHTAAAAASAALPGWLQTDLPQPATYYDRYLPASADPAAPAPLIVFLHGAGGRPENYRSFVEAAAEATGAVLVLPRSQGVGWGSPLDDQLIAEAVRLTQAEIAVDPERVSISGHSAGGAYSFLLGYGQRAHWSGIFALASPFYPVAALADPDYTPPIRMFYGTGDPNYLTAYPRLTAQWDRLGVAWTADVGAGYGHNSLPGPAVLAGFEFLTAQRYPAAPPATCVPEPTVLCLLGGRFQVELAWTVASGATGFGQVVPGIAPENSGLLWFFAPANWELLVKVLDGCAVNGHYWVFAAATTDVGTKLTVVDTETGAARSYANPLGQPAAPIQDTQAFACAAP